MQQCYRLLPVLLLFCLVCNASRRCCRYGYTLMPAASQIGLPTDILPGVSSDYEFKCLCAEPEAHCEWNAVAIVPSTARSAIVVVFLFIMIVFGVCI